MMMLIEIYRFHFSNLVAKLIVLVKKGLGFVECLGILVLFVKLIQIGFVLSLVGPHD